MFDDFLQVPAYRKSSTRNFAIWDPSFLSYLNVCQSDGEVWQPQPVAAVITATQHHLCEEATGSDLRRCGGLKMTLHLLTLSSPDIPFLFLYRHMNCSTWRPPPPPAALPASCRTPKWSRLPEPSSLRHNLQLDAKAPLETFPLESVSSSSRWRNTSCNSDRSYSAESFRGNGPSFLKSWLISRSRESCESLKELWALVCLGTPTSDLQKDTLLHLQQHTHTHKTVRLVFMGPQTRGTPAFAERRIISKLGIDAKRGYANASR